MKVKSEPRHIPQQFLVELEEQLQGGKISAAEFTTLCLIPGLFSSGMNFQKKTLVKNETNPSPIAEFLRQQSWKGFSDRIRRSLYEWHRDRYPLVLWNHIPTPLELLQVQASGQRVITVFKESSQWQEIHLGKTAWDFVVHDLIHADHFFENPIWRQGQIEFYQFVLRHWEHDMISLLRLHCADQFDYLIADMNSHPQHMYQTLSALSLLAWKKEKGLKSQARLDSQQENQFQNYLSEFLETR